MANTYGTLDVLKSAGVLNIVGNDYDARLMSLLDTASRMVDRLCNRHFYALNATRTFDGSATGILVPDLISISPDGLKTDADGDRIFETVWDSADYLLLPLNAGPEATSNPGSRPFGRVEVESVTGAKSEFPRGTGRVQISGEWGYWRHLRRAAETADAIADPDTTSIDVSARTDIEAGHTLLIDSEQLHVGSYSGDTLMVTRGVNGSAAAAHDAGSIIYIHEYPPPVVEATLLQAAYLWRRKDTPLPETLGANATEKLSRWLDPDVVLLVWMYRKPALGVGI